MPTIQTPATMAAAATALIPLVGTLDAIGDATKRAKASLLSAKIDDALTQASNLASQDVLTLLGLQAAPFAELQALDARAKAAAARVAADEARVDAAIAFATSVATFSIAVVAGNVAGATSQLGRCSDRSVSSRECERRARCGDVSTFSYLLASRILARGGTARPDSKYYRTHANDR